MHMREARAPAKLVLDTLLLMFAMRTSIAGQADSNKECIRAQATLYKDVSFATVELEKSLGACLHSVKY